VDRPDGRNVIERQRDYGVEAGVPRGASTSRLEKTDSLHSGQLRELADAVTEIFYRDTELVEECQVEVGKRRLPGVPEMAPAFDLPGRASRHQNGQVRVQVIIAVADAAAVNNGNMVEKRSIAIGSGAQFAQEIGELLHVIVVDPGQLGNRFRPVLMVGEPVVRIGNADFGIRSGANFARQ